MIQRNRCLTIDRTVVSVITNLITKMGSIVRINYKLYLKNERQNINMGKWYKSAMINKWRIQLSMNIKASKMDRETFN